MPEYPSEHYGIVAHHHGCMWRVYASDYPFHLTIALNLRGRHCTLYWDGSDLIKGHAYQLIAQDHRDVLDTLAENLALQWPHKAIEQQWHGLPKQTPHKARTPIRQAQRYG